MTGISTYAQALGQASRLKTMQINLDQLQTQLATGKKTQLFKGLETEVIASKRARADLQAIEIYDRNITVADRRIKIMMNSINEMQRQAENVVNAIEIQTQEGEFEIDSVGDLAKKSLDFMIALLNERDGDRFVFAGAETQNEPLTDKGTFNAYLQTQVQEWVDTNITTDELVSSYRERAQLTDTIMGYSATISSGNVRDVFVRVDKGAEISYTTLANDEGFRDIMAAMGMLETLSETLDEVTLDPDDNPLTTTTAPGVDKSQQSDNFYRVFNDLARMLNQGLDRLNRLEFDLSQRQAEMASIQKSYKLEQNILKNQIGDIEDADMNSVALQLNTLQIQLDASYRVTASLRQLTLANFL